MRLRFPLFIWLSLHCISLIHGSAGSLPSVDLLGISPQDEKYYSGLSSGGAIKCKNGSNTFTGAQLNDDFCDCLDGSDEPGTSACPNGKFYCRNAGHTPLLIYSSRVNDGICDCCDGSDEYGGKVKCPNMCWEAGKEARDKLKKKIAIYQEGVTIRKLEVEKAKLAIVNEEAELVKLTQEEKILKEIVEQLKEHKEQIETAEEKERLQREKEEKEKKEAEEAKLKDTKVEENYHEDSVNMENGIHDEISSEKASPTENVAEDHSSKVDKADSSDIPTMNETPGDEADRVGDDSLKHTLIEEEILSANDGSDPRSSSEVKDATEDTESLSKEELGRVVGSRWTGKKNEKESSEADANKDYHGDHGEEYNTYDSDDDDSEDQMDEFGGEDNSDSHLLSDDDDTKDQGDDFVAEDHDSSPPYSSSSSSSYDDGDDDELDLSDITSARNSHWLEKIKRNAQRIFQTFNLFRTPVDISEAARVRKEYDDSSAKLSKVQSRISKLTKKLKHDFGPEKEFYSFHGQCFEIKKNKYTYKICPFKKATQVEGHSTSYLGNWDKFEDSYRTMIFSNGDHCWNGPHRSMKVKVRCGLKNEVTDVDEPSRCEYLAFLSTPAVCAEEKLKELEDRLKVLNSELPQAHDEL